VRSLMTWLGEQFAPVQLALNTDDHQRGIKDRKARATSAIHRESVGRWRQALTAAETARIVAACAAIWGEIDQAGRYPRGGGGAGCRAGLTGTTSAATT